jgi:hypothetical protein
LTPLLLSSAKVQCGHLNRTEIGVAAFDGGDAFNGGVTFNGGDVFKGGNVLKGRIDCSVANENDATKGRQSWGRFREYPFRPKTFRANFYPQILDKLPSKNDGYTLI